MNLIILGAPGSGKGTQAKLIADKFHLTHISSGDLLREEVASGSEKGRLIGSLQQKGELVPFETIIDVVLEPAFRKAHDGFILDGTPREIQQAEYLDWFLKDKGLAKIDRVLYLVIPRNITLERLLKRAQIENRPDDNVTTINERLDVYEKETLPVIDYYRRQGILVDIDGTPTIEVIFKDICNKLTLA